MSPPVTTAGPDRLLVLTTTVLIVTAGVVVVAGLHAATVTLARTPAPGVPGA